MAERLTQSPAERFYPGSIPGSGFEGLRYNELSGTAYDKNNLKEQIRTTVKQVAV